MTPLQSITLLKSNDTAAAIGDTALVPFSSQLMRREHPCSSSVLISDGILPSGGVHNGVYSGVHDVVGGGGVSAASSLSNFTLPSRVRRSLELLQVTQLDT